MFSCCVPTHTHAVLSAAGEQRPHSQTSTMRVRVVLVLLLLCLAAGAVERDGALRKLECMEDSSACPLNLAPVCGSDGNTYANDCALCFHRQETRMDIVIVKEGTC